MIPLPRRWKSHVKSGLLHAISLARLAITVVRGECANSPVAAAQLASENQRLEEEVASLKEELRFKDARLARIPARERPQYPPTDRMAILTLQASRGWNTSEAADLGLTVVPITGLWAPWFPGAFLQLWPLCWWVLTIVDHFSRYAIGFALFPYQPTAAQVCAALDNAVRAVGRAPKYTVSDQGAQFQTEYRQWCAVHNVKPRFGAVGKYGSIAVIERFHLTIKQEALRLIHVPFNLADMRSEMVRTFAWYNLERPHMHWGGATPAEILHKRRPRNRRPRIEPRARYPADGACAAPHVKARAVGCRLQLVVSDFQGATHLPVVVLKKAA